MVEKPEKLRKAYSIKFKNNLYVVCLNKADTGMSFTMYQMAENWIESEVHRKLVERCSKAIRGLKRSQESIRTRARKYRQLCRLMGKLT